MNSKVLSIGTIAAVLVNISVVGSVSAADEIMTDLSEKRFGNGFFFSAEALSLQPLRGDGSSTSFFSREYSPRLSGGFQLQNGTGFRVRHWELDTSEATGLNNQPSAIDTDTLDLEAFREIKLDSGLAVELSAGARRVNYSDLNFSDASQTTEFEGWGGVFGIKGTQELFEGISVYGSGRFSVLAGDAIDNGTIENDTSRNIVEIAAGVEGTFAIGSTEATVHAGYEWWNWEGFQDNADGAIGFSGFVGGATIKF